MTEHCNKRVSDLLIYTTIIDQITKGRSLNLALLEYLLMSMIFTSLWWIIPSLYDVGRPTCYHRFQSMTRDEPEAVHMPWKTEAFLCSIAQWILKGLQAIMAGKPLW